MMNEVTRFLSLLLVGAVVLAVGTASTAAAAEPTEPGLIVELHEDGSATVTLRTTYDLASDEEARAFTDLREDDDAREKLVEKYKDRMSRVAATAATETGRTMQVTNERIELSTSGDVGVVALSVQWEGLAATDTGRLVVTRPFAGDFESDHSLTLVGPHGYDVTATNPSPDSQTENRLTWQSGTELNEFEVTFASSDAAESEASGDSTDTGTNTPGFGIVIASVALLGAALLARLRE